jgi:hypothetical protein
MGTEFDNSRERMNRLMPLSLARSMRQEIMLRTSATQTRTLI